MSLPEFASPRFVGREAEIAALAKAIERPPALALVEGEAGIGKSRLLREFLAVDEGRHRVALAACPPYRESLTLGPIVDAIRLAGRRIDGLQLSDLAGALRPLFPEWAAQLPPAPDPLDDAKAERHRLFRALAEVVDGLGVTILVVEDVHWADDPTMEFLLFLTSRPQPASPSLVLTFRPEDVPPDSLLIRLSSRTSAGRQLTRIALPALDVGHTAELLSSMFGGEPISDDFAAFLNEHADGIPLAIEESVRLMRHRDDVMLRDGVWVRRKLHALRVPPTIRDSVLERIQRVSDPACAVLDAAAVLGEPASEGLLAEVADLDAPDVESALSEAADSGLLSDDGGRIGFRHTLTGRAVYDALPAGRRRQLHLRAGRALDVVKPLPVAQLARHFREAGVPDRWAAYAEQTAEVAADANDYTAAVSTLHDLVAVADIPVDVRARLATKLATAATLRREQVDELHRQVIDTLRQTVDTAELARPVRAEIRRLLGSLFNQAGDLEDGQRELERALPDLDHDPEAAAQTMTYLAWSGTISDLAPVERCRHWLHQAAELVPLVRTPAAKLSLTGDLAFAYLLIGDAAGWEIAGNLPATASTARERREILRGNANIGGAAILWGEYADARRRLERAFDLAEGDQYLRPRGTFMSLLVELDWLTGNWERLDARVDALLGDNGDLMVLSDAFRVSAALHGVRGDRSVAEEKLREALERAVQAGHFADTILASAALGQLLLSAGRSEDALAATTEPMRTLRTRRAWIWAANVAPVRVEALVATGSIEESQRLVSEFEAGLSGCDAAAPLAALATCQASLLRGRGESARAAAAFDQAADAWERLPRPYDAWLVRERQAECLLAADQPHEALDLLGKVHRGLSELGARNDADRVARRLREHGVQVSLPWRGGRRGYGDQLSPRELDVARLVAAGQTNRQIAEALSRSPKTVSSQLRSAMRKLGVASRTALAVSLVRADEPPESDDSPESGRTLSS